MFYGEQAVEVREDRTIVLDKVGAYEIRYTATDAYENEENLSVSLRVEEKPSDASTNPSNDWLVAVVIGASVLVFGAGAAIAIVLWKRKKR